MVSSLFVSGVSSSRQEPKARAPAVESLSAGGELLPVTGNSPPARDNGSAAARAALDQALHSLSDHVQTLQRTLQFSVDKESRRTIIKVIDSATNEIIRQIPPEEMLVIANRLQAATGVLLVEKA